MTLQEQTRFLPVSVTCSCSLHLPSWLWPVPYVMSLYDRVCCMTVCMCMHAYVCVCHAKKPVSLKACRTGLKCGLKKAQSSCHSETSPLEPRPTRRDLWPEWLPFLCVNEPILEVLIFHRGWWWWWRWRWWCHFTKSVRKLTAFEESIYFIIDFLFSRSSCISTRCTAFSECNDKGIVIIVYSPSVLSVDPIL